METQYLLTHIVLVVVLSLDTTLYDIKEIPFFHTAWENVSLNIIGVVFLLRRTFRKKKAKYANESIAWWRYTLAVLLSLPFFVLGVIFLSDGIFVLLIFSVLTTAVLCTTLLSKWKNHRLSLFKKGEPVKRNK